MDKYAVAYSYTEILPINKNKVYLDTHYINETHKHCLRQKKPNMKENILYDSIFMIF